MDPDGPARGHRPYARVAGGALTSDAFHVSAPEPNGRYATAAIRLALERAKTDPDALDLVCAHGTSTRANDVTETGALHQALGDSAHTVAVTAPKSMVGHLIGAAGAVGAIVCCMAIRDAIVPPTINLVHPDPECDLDYVPHKARVLPVQTAITNAFGFGGQNCVAAFQAIE